MGGGATLEGGVTWEEEGLHQLEGRTAQCFCRDVPPYYDIRPHTSNQIGPHSE